MIRGKANGRYESLAVRFMRSDLEEKLEAVHTKPSAGSTATFHRLFTDAPVHR